MSISKQENSQSIQTLLSGKQPLNSPSHSKREPSAYSLRLSQGVGLGIERQADYRDVEAYRSFTFLTGKDPNDVRGERQQLRG